MGILSDRPYMVDAMGYVVDRPYMVDTMVLGRCSPVVVPRFSRSRRLPITCRLRVVYVSFTCLGRKKMYKSAETER